MPNRTLSSLSQPYPYRSRIGTYQIDAFESSTCASSAVIRYGDVVAFDVNTSSANYRLVRASTTASAPTVQSTSILGVALGGSTRDGSTFGLGHAEQIPVCLATPQTEFWFATKSSQVVSSCVGQRRALAFDSTLSIFYVNMGNSSEADASVVITDIPEPGPWTNNGVVGRFISSGVAQLVVDIDGVEQLGGD